MDMNRTLNNGVQMPRLGLGVWRSKSGEETVNAVRWAMEAGYRHVDTAALYANEESVGQGIRESGVPIDDVFITTKLWDTDQGYDSALKAFEDSRKRLGVEVVDLYLIHWPRPPEKRADSWRALEHLYEQGAVRAIGVSNYMPQHLEELMAQANVPPTVNQFELSVFNYASRQAVITACTQHDIAVEAYSPIALAKKLEHPGLVTMAEKYGRTPVQVMLRWLLQKDVIVIPKSVNRDRIIQNGQLFDFEIDEDDMEAMRDFDEDLFYAPDPRTMP